MFHKKTRAKSILDFKNYYYVSLSVSLYNLFVLTSYYLLSDMRETSTSNLITKKLGSDFMP